ncbi:hypothetical protein MKX01_014965 [Papaver californicum]|nr:hypothetical protein MKX01_014965 [Papaver californicum]
MATTKNNRALMKNNNCALMKMTTTNNKSLMKLTTFGSTTVVAGPSTPSVAVPNTFHPASNIQVEEKIHFSHPQHPLVKVNLPYMFTCMGCKEFGAGNRFSCQKCDFDLHEFCALAPPTILKHPLHSQHQLVFHTKAASGFLRSRCDICGKSTKGYAFRCSTCTFEMHPCCSKLDIKEDFKTLHPHTLKLLPSTTLISSEAGIKCNECKTKRPGRAYGCEVCDKYHIHAVCAKNMINGLNANGFLITPEKPSLVGTAARIASNVVIGFIGGLIEGLGEGVGGAIVDNFAKGKNNNAGRRRKK